MNSHRVVLYEGDKPAFVSMAMPLESAQTLQAILPDERSQIVTDEEGLRIKQSMFPAISIAGN